MFGIFLVLAARFFLSSPSLSNLSPTFNLYLTSPPYLRFFVEVRDRYVLVQVRTERNAAVYTQADESDIITFLRPYLESLHKAFDNNQTPH